MLKNSFLRNILAFALVLVGIFLLASTLNTGEYIEDAYYVTKIPVGLIDLDGSALSDDFEKYLTETLEMEVTKDLSEDNLTDMLINREISAIIEIPSDFGKSAAAGSPSNISYTALDDYENAAFLEIYLNSYMRKIALLSESAGGNAEKFETLLDKSEADVSGISSADNSASIEDQQRASFQLAAGAFLMFSMAFSMVIALTVLDDKKFGTYNRMQISPVSSAEYISGTALFGIVIGLIFSAGFLVSIVLKGINPGLPIWLIAVMLVLFTLFSVGFSLIVALIVKNKTMILTITCGLTTILCILGGAWFPVDKSNVVLSKLAALTPHYWFMETIRGVQGDATFNFLPAVAMLTLFAVLTYLIAAAVFAKKQ